MHAHLATPSATHVCKSTGVELKKKNPFRLERLGAWYTRKMTHPQGQRYSPLHECLAAAMQALSFVHEEDDYTKRGLHLHI